jgi:hypothetical protein
MLLLVAGSTSCGLTADFGGLQGGAMPDGAVTDAPGSDAAANDAAKTFCESLPAPVKLCTDFDEGGAVDTGWDTSDLTLGGAVSVTMNAFSAPGAFLSAVNPIDDPLSARLLENVPTSSPHVHVEFEMSLIPSDGTFELAVIHQVANDTTYGLFFREVSSALQAELRTLNADGSEYSMTWPIGPPPSGWTHVLLDLDVADSGSFTVQQGATVITQTNVPTSTSGRTSMFVELGLYSFDPAGAQATFDNATIDWE